jgi:hypothetical protein
MLILVCICHAPLDAPSGVRDPYGDVPCFSKICSCRVAASPIQSAYPREPFIERRWRTNAVADKRFLPTGGAVITGLSHVVGEAHCARGDRAPTARDEQREDRRVNRSRATIDRVNRALKVATRVKLQKKMIRIRCVVRVSFEDGLL